MDIRTVGIDLGKSVFHLVGVSAAGKGVISRAEHEENVGVRKERNE